MHVFTIQNIKLAKENVQKQINIIQLKYAVEIILKWKANYYKFLLLVICYQYFIIVDSKLKLLPNLKDISVTSQSTTFKNSLKFDSSNAIDDVENYDIDNCRCCSVTEAEHLWWRINLDKPYLIGGIEVFGRQSGELLKLVFIKCRITNYFL